MLPRFIHILNSSFLFRTEHVPFYIHPTVGLPICSLVDIWAVSTLQLHECCRYHQAWVRAHSGDLSVLIWLSESARAAITNHHWLTFISLSSGAWELLDQGASRVGSILKPLFLASRQLPSHWVRTWQRSLSLPLLKQPHILWHKGWAPALGPHLTWITPLNAWTPNTVTLKVRTSTYEFWRSIIQAMVQCISRSGPTGSYANYI